MTDKANDTLIAKTPFCIAIAIKKNSPNIPQYKGNDCTNNKSIFSITAPKDVSTP